MILTCYFIRLNDCFDPSAYHGKYPQFLSNNVGFSQKILFRVIILYWHCFNRIKERIDLTAKRHDFVMGNGIT